MLGSAGLTATGSPRPCGCVHHIGLDGEVVIEEIGWEAGIGENAAHLGGGKEDRLGSVPATPL